MKRTLFALCQIALLVVLAISSAPAAEPVANKFKISAKVSGLVEGRIYSFTFRLFDAATDGNELFEETKSYKVPSGKSITHLLGSVNLAQPLQAGDFLQQVWVQVSTETRVFPRFRIAPMPLAIGSQNADLLDGLHAADFALEGHAHGGAGSGLDADLFDGRDGAFYQDAGNLTAGALSTDRYSAYDDLATEGCLGDAAGDIARNNGILQATLYAERASTADSAVTAETANALSATALSALDARYGLAPQSKGLIGFATSTAVDSTGDVGLYTSITIGADGLPIISYYDNTNFHLKVLHCGNASCNSGNNATTVDSGNMTGNMGTSITIGTDGLPIIAYYDNPNFALKVLHCGDASCSSGNSTHAFFGGLPGGFGEFSSLAIGADGFPVISYFSSMNDTFSVIHCGDPRCSSGNTFATVDQPAGLYNSITIGTDGLPVIAYSFTPDTPLKILHCGNAACSSGNTSTAIDGSEHAGYYPSITIGADGLPVIAHHDTSNGDVKVLHCGNAACSSGNISTVVDSADDVGDYPSISIGVDGLPIIAYYDSTNQDLKMLHCGNAACSFGNTTTIVDASGDVGNYASITIGADGLAVISYRDRTNGGLKVARVFFKPLGRR